MRVVITDGGRAAAGYKGKANDCVVRAFAIATGRTYAEVYALVNSIAGSAVARTGVSKKITRKVAEALGMVWVPVMQVGSGCRMHLKEDEVPKGKIVVSLSRHVVAVIDGVVHDTYDSTREGSRCVYGYYKEGVCLPLRREL